MKRSFTKGSKSTQEKKELRPLPEGWIWTTLGETGQLLRGVSYRKEDANEQAKNDFVPVLRATNIQDEKLILARDLVYVPSRYIKATQYLKPGDIVVCMSSGSKHLVGKTAQLNQEWKGSFGTFCAAIRPQSTVNPKFLGYFFSSPKYRQFIREKSSGININNLKPSDFETLEIPLPLLAEQKRIVARLEELLSDLEAGVAALERVRVGVKRYKASVLKAACEGNLFGDGGIKNGELNEGWRWVTVEQLAKREKGSMKRGPFGSTVKKAYFVPKGYKIYEQQNVIHNDFTLGSYYIDKQRFELLRGFQIFPGDLLITGAGTIGKIAIVPEGIEAGIINQALLKISFDHNVVETQFFIIWFETRLLDYLIAQSRGSAMKNISSMKDLKKMNFALPPLEEQRRIVAEVEQRLEAAREVETAVEVGLRRAGRLRQAVLKAAFEGRLSQIEQSTD